MKIGIPVGHYHPGNPSDFISKALQELGHQVQILTPEELQQSHSQFDKIIGIDSGSPIPFPEIFSSEKDLSRVSMWFIDFRHNWNRSERVPNDLQSAQFLESRGGKIFQAQKEDVDLCHAHQIFNCTWLPLAADPSIWAPSPEAFLPPPLKNFDLAFAGNIFDQSRLDVLKTVQATGVKFAFPGPGKIWLADAAKMLSHARIGFNVTSFFGSSVAYDINMRFFETLSTGVPLLTNKVPSMDLFDLPSSIRTFETITELPEKILQLLSDQDFLTSGTKGREWILNGNTYKDRAIKLLSIRISISREYRKPPGTRNSITRFFLL
jgi:hypothetical protein